MYAHQPQCESILAQGMDFILTCKESSHSTLYEWVNELAQLHKVREISTTEKRGRKTFVNHYRFVNEVPIRGGEDALMVNWCELTTTDQSGKVVYFSSFATSHEIDEENVANIVLCGRARWHIENGNNNTLKTKGYHLTHNFGHGKENLAAFLLHLNLLAFLFHTILEIQDECYSAIRQELSSRETFFRDIQALTRYGVFRNWSHLMEFMMAGLEITLLDSG